jgi:hypothetical protein
VQLAVQLAASPRPALEPSEEQGSQLPGKLEKAFLIRVHCWLRSQLQPPHFHGHAEISFINVSDVRH